MTSKSESLPQETFQGLDPELSEALTTFEAFFKSFGFKQVHGRVWGLLVLSGQPLSSKEVLQELGISQGAASTTLNQLIEWGAVMSTFDTGRRCHVHSPVGNTLSIVATVLRRREQVAFTHFHAGMSRTLLHVNNKFGSKDPRVLTLRSILSTCEIADAVMQLVFNSVSGALGDPQSMLSRTIQAALKFGIGMDGKKLSDIPAHALDPKTLDTLETLEAPVTGEDRKLG
ncbi:MAG: putative transcriptional regulator [Glaciecola sp.]|jgi:predicted transcriptional regulator